MEPCPWVRERGGSSATAPAFYKSFRAALDAMTRAEQ